mmetsp:Transcript_55600/g.63829  ORF Transcript_55600/g.63829 Transcript_55600/m.63829 type:complete len:257 (-) Transcript_55600:60-830(-)
MNGCFVGALIARSSDRLPLCTFTDPSFQAAGSAAQRNTIQQQLQKILDRLKPPATGPNGEIIAASQYQSFDNKDVIFFVFTDPATNITILVALNKILLRSDANGTNRLACAALESMFSEFIAMYPPSQINSGAMRTYGCIKFDVTLQKIIARVVQQDKKLSSSGAQPASGSSQAYDSLKQELRDVHVVIRQNLEDLMTRGEKLETMNNYSASLKDQSSKYYKKTVHMNRMRVLKTYGPPVAVGLLLILFFFWYFIW